MTSVLPIVAAYEEAIRSLLGDREDGRRFQKIRKMCEHAADLERAFAESRASSFNDDDECSDNNFILGQRIAAPVGGESQDMIRELMGLVGPLVESQSRRSRAEADRELAASLVDLCKARESLGGFSHDLSDLDDKIVAVRSHLTSTRRLVPDVVLSGTEVAESVPATPPLGDRYAEA